MVNTPILILIIEDDRKTASLVSMYLEKEGFKTVTADDGEEGVGLAERLKPDLIILDLMLPKFDGWEVCRRVREVSEVPIIMLTARGEEEDRVTGLTMGADDYVVKPFSPRELAARVQAVMRRGGRPESEKDRLIYKDLVLDAHKRKVTKTGQTIDLTAHEFSLLQALMRSPGRVFNRDELMEYLYPRGETVVIDRVIDVHIGKIRQKIEDDPTHPTLIQTVRGVGYRFGD